MIYASLQHRYTAWMHDGLYLLPLPMRVSPYLQPLPGAGALLAFGPYFFRLFDVYVTLPWRMADADKKH
jgi:hypothetical protein